MPRSTDLADPINSPECRVIDLGQMDYAQAWAIQRRMADLRGAEAIPDTLLWVEHPHVYTLGTAADTANVLLSPDELAARGIALYPTDRGGDVTYHGPGQIVGYPILRLPKGKDGLHADVVAYVRGLERAIIRALAEFGLSAGVLPGLTGVWVETASGPAKIAAIGVRVTTRRVSLHGFALNVNTDLSYFQGIVPCGIRDKAVTSMQQMIGQPLDMTEARAALAQAFAGEFDRALRPMQKTELEAACHPFV